jgi:hypothetical protein
MMTNVEINARPVTQQGMSGMKTAGQGPGRQVSCGLHGMPAGQLVAGSGPSLRGVWQVADKSFFLNTLRQKIQEINTGVVLPPCTLPHSKGLTETPCGIRNGEAPRRD